MYEKYSGLPDTSKPTPASGRTSERSPAMQAYASDSSGGTNYSYTPNRGGSSSGRRSGARRAKARKRRLIMGLAGLAFLALIVVAVVLLSKGCAPSTVVDVDTGKFRSGVVINWTDVSGKTVDEVRPLLESNETDSLNKIAITLSGEEINATVTGADMNASSNLNDIIQQALEGGANQEYKTTISIDDTALAARIEEINQTSSKPPVDATVTFDFSNSGNPSPVYVDGTPGFGLDVASTVTLIKQTIESGQMQATLTPAVTTVEPSLTAEDIKSHTALIGSYKTTYDYKGTAEDTEEQRTIYIPNRAFNVEKASSEINKQVIKPGQKWSFNDEVGDRTEQNGWRLAQGIFGGDRKTPQFGGGVCQVSTTLYNALLQAYPYVQGSFVRTRHSIPSTYVEKGLDATVDTNHIDFAFTNHSEYPIYIFSYTTENKMAKSRKRDIYVKIYGEALPAGIEYKPRTVLVLEEIPAEEEITETSKLFIGEENILADAHTHFIVDVYVDRYLDGVLQESMFDHTDDYPGNPLRKQVGTKPTPSPEPTPTPVPTEGP